MLPPRRREDRLRLLVSVSLGGCAQKEHRDSLGLPYKRDMEACAHFFYFYFTGIIMHCTAKGNMQKFTVWVYLTNGHNSS